MLLRRSDRVIPPSFFFNSALIPTMLDGKRTRVRAATGRSRVSRVRAATGRSRVSTGEHECCSAASGQQPLSASRRNTTSEHECRSAASGQQPLSASRRNTAHSQARAAQRRGAAADNVFEAVAHRVQFTNHPKILTSFPLPGVPPLVGRRWRSLVKVTILVQAAVPESAAKSSSALWT